MSYGMSTSRCISAIRELAADPSHTTYHWNMGGRYLAMALLFLENPSDPALGRLAAAVHVQFHDRVQIASPHECSTLWVQAVRVLRIARGLPDVGSVESAFRAESELVVSALERELTGAPLRKRVENTAVEPETSGTELVGRSGLAPMTDDQREIWDALDGRILMAKEFAHYLGKRISAEAARKRIEAIQATGRKVSNHPKLGYFRPDRPPPDLMPEDQV